jgi:hypothetical protein
MSVAFERPRLGATPRAFRLSMRREAESTQVPKRNPESSRCVTQATGGPTRRSGPKVALSHEGKPAALPKRRAPWSWTRRDVRVDGGSTVMKRFILTAALLGGFIAFGAVEANAFVCAPGVYLPGCAGPRGAMVRHRQYNGGIYPGGIYQGGAYPRGAYPGSPGGVSRNIGPNQITPGGATIPGGR